MKRLIECPDQRVGGGGGGGVGAVWFGQRGCGQRRSAWAWPFMWEHKTSIKTLSPNYPQSHNPIEPRYMQPDLIPINNHMGQHYVHKALKKEGTAPTKCLYKLGSSVRIVYSLIIHHFMGSQMSRINFSLLKIDDIVD